MEQNLSFSNSFAEFLARLTEEERMAALSAIPSIIETDTEEQINRKAQILQDLLEG